MATARKISKKASKAKPPVTVASSFLKPKKASKAKSKSKATKPTADLPPELAGMMNEYAAADAVAKAATRKAATAKSAILVHTLENFAQKWASTGTRPETCTWKGERAQFDHEVSSAITFDVKKQEAIEDELGIDMGEHFNVSALKIDIAKISGNETHMAALETFLNALGEDVDEYVNRDFKLSKEFFGNLAQICEKNPDRLSTMLQILKPRVSPKNIKSLDQEESLFKFVMNMKG